MQDLNSKGIWHPIACLLLARSPGQVLQAVIMRLDSDNPDQ